MDDQDGVYDSETWHDKPGANTGDRRENDPSAPGFTDDRNRVFRSQFQHANSSTKAFSERSSEQLEVDSTSESGALPADPAKQGRVEGLPPSGTTPTHDRVSFTDPLAGNMDPTEPGSPTERPTE